MEVTRFDVFLVNLDPSVGSEIRKARPCVIVSPDEMNRHVNTVMIAPMTTVYRKWPSRVAVRFGGTHGQVAVDQMRAVDRTRLIRRLGTLSATESAILISTIQEFFA